MVFIFYSLFSYAILNLNFILIVVRIQIISFHILFDFYDSVALVNYNAVGEVAMNNFSFVCNLNPTAEVFCPSKRSNNIASMNNFPRNVNLIYSNLQGMLEGCHLEEFRNEIVKTKGVHILAITESWLRNGVNTNKTINIPGFRVLRSDRHISGGDWRQE